MNGTVLENGLVEVRKTYTAFVDGRSVVVSGVPFQIDPETDDEFIAPDVAELLYEMVRNPAARSSIGQADVYHWEESELEQPELSFRFTGKGFDYGQTPISQFARTVDRVRDGTVGLMSDLGRREQLPVDRLDPYLFEPRLRWVGAGSLVIALDPPDRGLFENLPEDRLARTSVDLLVDGAQWLANDAPEDVVPDSLSEPAVRAMVMYNLSRILPSDREPGARVEIHGKATERRGSPVVLDHQNRRTARGRFVSATAERQAGVAVTIRGHLSRIDESGSLTLKNVLNWEGPRTVKGKFDPKEPELAADIGALWRLEVLAGGVLHRKPNGQVDHVQVLYLERASDE